LMAEQESVLKCPLCGGEDFAKWGFIYSHKLETWMKKLAQAYMCKRCGTKIAPNHKRKNASYPKWFKEAATQLYEKDPLKTCLEISEELSTRFSIPVNRHLIYLWISNYSQKPIQFRMQKNWRSRRKHYGTSGMSEEWREKRHVAQKLLWKKPEYSEYMSKVHRHPRHNLDVIQFCFSLKDSGLSIRKIALEANKKFGTKLAHDTIAKWFQKTNEKSRI